MQNFWIEVKWRSNWGDNETVLVTTGHQGKIPLFVSLSSTRAIKSSRGSNVFPPTSPKCLPRKSRGDRKNKSKSGIHYFSLFYFLFFTTSADFSPSFLSPDVKVAVAIGGRIINQIFASLPCSLLHCPLLMDIQFVGRITKSYKLPQCYLSIIRHVWLLLCLEALSKYN